MTQRQLPWGHNNVVLDKGNGRRMTSEELIREANLDWEVGQHPLYTQVFGRPVRCEDRYAIVRETDNAVLGFSSGRYEIFQNREIFNFADELVIEEGATFTAGGELGGGRQIFAVMELPEKMMIGGEDEHKLYIFFRTSHDGSSAVSAFITPIRMYCTNTMTAALRGAKNKWTIPHRVGMREALKDAQNAMSNVSQYVDAFSDTAETLLLKSITDDKAMDIYEHILPKHITQREELVEDLMDTYLTSQFNEFQGTAWGVYCGMTEHYDHMRKKGGTEDKLINTSVVGGQTSKMRDNLMSLLIAE